MQEKESLEVKGGSERRVEAIATEKMQNFAIVAAFVVAFGSVTVAAFAVVATAIAAGIVLVAFANFVETANQEKEVEETAD